MHLCLNFIFVLISAQNSYLFSFQLVVETQLATHLRLVTQGLHLQFLFFLMSTRCTHWYIVYTTYMPMGVPHYTKSIHQHKPLTFSLRACIYFLKYLNLYHFFNICYHGKKTQSIAAWIKLDNSPGKRNDEKGNLLQAKVFTHMCI